MTRAFPAGSAADARLRAFDPVQIAWLDAALRDDLDPVLHDPLGALPGPDPLGQHGLALHPWRLADCAAFRALLDDAAVWLHLPEAYPAPLTEALAHDLIVGANTLAHHTVRALWNGAQPVGQVRLERAGTPHEAEISYWLGRAYWGQGLGSALVDGAAARAFGNDPALLRLVAKVHPANHASRRILERAGFVPGTPPDGSAHADWLWLALRRQNRPSVAGGISSDASP
ncbi:MAG: GNAT family N-acetyltransferase [Pararhodobacter sp.]